MTRSSTAARARLSAARSHRAGLRSSQRPISGPDTTAGTPAASTRPPSAAAAAWLTVRYHSRATSAKASAVTDKTSTSVSRRTLAGRADPRRAASSAGITVPLALAGAEPTCRTGQGRRQADQSHSRHAVSAAARSRVIPARALAVSRARVCCSAAVRDVVTAATASARAAVARSSRCRPARVRVSGTRRPALTAPRSTRPASASRSTSRTVPDWVRLSRGNSQSIPAPGWEPSRTRAATSRSARPACPYPATTASTVDSAQAATKLASSCMTHSYHARSSDVRPVPGRRRSTGALRRFGLASGPGGDRRARGRRSP